MLRDFRIHPLLATSDAVRARAWYADKLGLEPVFEREGQLVYSVPPTVFTVYETSFAGTAQNTVAVWTVDDLRSEVAPAAGPRCDVRRARIRAGRSNR